MRKKQSSNYAAYPAAIGLPRAFLYYRYETLWKTFLQELGMDYTVSPETNRAILENGKALTPDEACLSLKLYIGHVNELIGKCDYILVPRINNFGLRRVMCTRFQALPDLCRNIFRNSGQKFLSYDIDVQKKVNEEKAFLFMGAELGFPRKSVQKSYNKAKNKAQDEWKHLIQKEEKRYKDDRVKILIAGHSYLTQDAYIGEPIIKMLEEMDAVPILADRTDRKKALKQAEIVSPTNKWQMNRELMGSIRMHQHKIDGVILLSSYPCGPDSMADEMIIRRFPNLPIQTIVLDEQEGLAGLETRLESFTDVLRLKRGEL